jgi:hypothetical protein
MVPEAAPEVPLRRRRKYRPEIPTPTPRLFDSIMGAGGAISGDNRAISVRGMKET